MHFDVYKNGITYCRLPRPSYIDKDKAVYDRWLHLSPCPRPAVSIRILIDTRRLYAVSQTSEFYNLSFK